MRSSRMPFTHQTIQMTLAGQAGVVIDVAVSSFLYNWRHEARSQFLRLLQLTFLMAYK